MSLVRLVCYFIVYLGTKALADEATLKSLNIGKGGAIYFKDLGPQLGWTTVSPY